MFVPLRGPLTLDFTYVTYKLVWIVMIAWIKVRIVMICFFKKKKKKKKRNCHGFEPFENGI